MGFTDKPYEGFLGDSYVGRWCTLGAGTTTANIKATLGQVDVHIGSSKIETGRRSMGAIIGDHTKTAINTGPTILACLDTEAVNAASTLKPRIHGSV